MSRKSIVTKVPCPHCGKEMMFKIKREIEIPDDMVYKSKIMKNKLFDMHCKDCDIHLNSSYDCSYNDMDQHYMIWVRPNLNETVIKEMVSYNETIQTDDALRLARNDYRMRVVRNDKELKEKILIFDDNLDDRIIEIMKLSYIPYIRQELKIDSEVEAFYFTKAPKTGEYQWLIFLKDNRPLIGKVDMKQYEELKEDLLELVEARTTHGMTFINPKWAIDTMRIRMSADPSQEKINVEELLEKERQRVEAAMNEAMKNA